MGQNALFYESLNDALNDVIKACGGPKVVACKLWPEKEPNAAARLLHACLNESRPEKLDPDQVLLLLRMGRDADCHVAMDFVAGRCGYDVPKPITEEDAQAVLMRDFIAAQRHMGELAKQMQAIGMLRVAS